MPQAKSATRSLPIDFWVGPVDALQLGDRQTRQQRRRRGQRVEGRQVLAVGDQPLEYAASQVVGVVDAGGVDRLRGEPQPRQNRGGVTRRKLLQNASGDGEDGPVIDFTRMRVQAATVSSLGLSTDLPHTRSIG